MSAQPSPDGSPVGAGTEGQGATAGEVLAMRMIQAAESAATAAQAATQAVAALTANAVGSQSTNSGKPEWYKVLPKPSTFEPKDREAELSGFRDWWWQVEQYIVAVDSSYGQDLLYIRSHLDEEMPLVEQDPEKTRRSGFLYGLLASLLKQGNGMEAVRQLFRTCQPSSRNRSLGLLHVIMQWPSFDMKSALLPQMLKLEDSFREYEKIASPLPEEIRFAVLMKVLGGQLKTYLQVTLKDGTSYEDLRESALRYDQSTIRWRQSMKLGSSVAFQGTLQFLWMWTEWRKEKVRRARAKVALKVRTKVKVIKKVRLLEREVQTMAKDTTISSLGVRDKPRGRAAHGMQLVTTLARVANLENLGKAKMGAKAKISRATSAENQVTLQETVECVLLDRMRTQPHRCLRRPMQGAIQQVAM